MTPTPLTLTELQQGIEILDKVMEHWHTLNNDRGAPPQAHGHAVLCYNDTVKVRNDLEDLVRGHHQESMTNETKIELLLKTLEGIAGWITFKGPFTNKGARAMAHAAKKVIETIKGA